MHPLATNPSITDSEIRQNITHIRERIHQACIRVGRNPQEVKLLLATKTVPAARIRVALEAGEGLLGENKIQEGQAKFNELQSHRPTWHMIGHLQSNKVKYALQFAHLIESVDRLSLVEKLQKRLEYEQRTLDIFIQVNTSYEPSKFGVAPEKALAFVQTVAGYDRLAIKGLMTIGLFSSEPEKVRPSFRLLKQLQQEAIALNLPGAEFKELSMGMSGDLEIAIEEGATLVRVGTAIFGQRNLPDSYYWNETTTVD